jgi:predicted phosphodiesterase
MSKVLVVGDIHAPATHKDYYSFVRKIQKKYNTDKTVFIGDIIDHEAISRHEKNPDLPAALDEFNIATKEIHKWHKAFPNSMVCIGNHDERVVKTAKGSGIPSLYLKPYNEVYNTEGWDWKYEFKIDGILYTHGTGWSGLAPAFNAAKQTRQSVVCGHTHSNASISYHSNGSDTIFGMNVGCGVDDDHLAMSYGRYSLKKPVFSCGVVINGQPYLETRKDKS